jgi:hypothetical protein
LIDLLICFSEIISDFFGTFPSFSFVLNTKNIENAKIKEAETKAKKK